MTIDPVPVLFVAGTLHFTQVPAIVLTPRLLDWQGDFAQLSPINRQIVKVVLGGIMLCVLGLGVVVTTSASELLLTGVGRRVCIFLAIFWAYRAIIQIFVYAKTWPRRALWAHACLSLLFPVLAGLYAFCAMAAGSRS